MRYFFLENLKAPDLLSKVFIGGSDARHIKNVLRLEPGDIIGLFDGKGAEYKAKITAFHKTGVEVSIIGQFQKKTGSELQIIVAQALLKDRKMEGLIRQLTELGVSTYLPFISQRSVSRPEGKRQILRAERWRKIAKESLKQCRRAQVLNIENIVTFEGMLNFSVDSDLKIAFWEEAAESMQSAVHLKDRRKVKKIFAILGPEGGFASEEMDIAREVGFVMASLGPRILRSETAAVAACTILQYLFGDIG